MPASDTGVMSPRAVVLLRLDDACPTMDEMRWGKIERLLFAHGVKPIVAIVPANEDPQLERSSPNPRFWDRALAWQSAGWSIGMHGFSHRLQRSAAGLVPVNRYSEFVGVSEGEQRRRIREGVDILEKRGLAPVVWVAPAHGLDPATLLSLRAESKMRIISDGLSMRPFRRWGFTWLPQQLWRPRAVTRGFWTLCIHPNDMDDDAVRRLEAYISSHRDSFGDPHSAAASAVDFGLTDALAGAVFSTALRFKRISRAHSRTRVSERSRNE